ncbi:hypothetical protein ACFO9Q_14080 [Paenibacillus sp. GCM10023252]|uniref:hypothetical protein n=1 Tax=Paenibacillus sp. GCM10023252 TaxID=3252649 RepID=UPI0036246007
MIVVYLFAGAAVLYLIIYLAVITAMNDSKSTKLLSDIQQLLQEKQEVEATDKERVQSRDEL